MPMTAQNVIDAALRKIGVIGSGSSPSAEESADGLSALNLMLANWSAQGLPIPYLSTDTFAGSSATSYTIGPSGTVNTTRPLAIKSMTVTSTGGLAVQFDPVTLDEYWTANRNKVFAYNPGVPLGTLYMRPAISFAQIDVVSYKELAQATNLAYAFSTLPPGYERALVFNLAVDLAPEFGVEPSQVLIGLANDAKQSIQGLNAAVLGNVPSLAAPPAAAGGAA